MTDRNHAQAADRRVSIGRLFELLLPAVAGSSDQRLELERLRGRLAAAAARTDGEAAATRPPGGGTGSAETSTGEADPVTRRS